MSGCNYAWVIEFSTFTPDFILRRNLESHRHPAQRVDYLQSLSAWSYSLQNLAKDRTQLLSEMLINEEEMSVSISPMRCGCLSSLSLTRRRWVSPLPLSSRYLLYVLSGQYIHTHGAMNVGVSVFGLKSICAERLANYDIVISNTSYGYSSLLVD